MGKQHWTSAFSHLEAWLASRPASAAGSSKPGSEISSVMDSGDDVSDKLVISTTDPLVEDLVVQESNGVNSNMGDNVLPITVAATPLTPSTIQPIVVPLSVQDTPSVSGSSCVPLISMRPAAPTAPTAVPLISDTASGTHCNAARCTHCYASLAYYVRQLGLIKWVS